MRRANSQYVCKYVCMYVCMYVRLRKYELPVCTLEPKLVGVYVCSTGNPALEMGFLSSESTTAHKSDFFSKIK